MTYLFTNILIPARKFHELNQAYELLLDPLRRMALDAKMRLKEARKARYAQYDSKRKNMLDDLEEAERAVKKAKVEKAAKEKEMWRENERIMEEGRILREQKAKELYEKVEEAERRTQTTNADGIEPPTLGQLRQYLLRTQSLTRFRRHTRYYHQAQVSIKIPSFFNDRRKHPRFTLAVRGY